MRHPFLIVLLLSLLPQALHAGQQGNFIYSKTLIRIIPKAASAVQEEINAPPKTGGKNEAVPDAQSFMPSLRRVPKEFTIEVRDAAFLRQKDFIAHQPFSDREGLMIEVNPPAEASLEATRMIATADVLFVDVDGNIIKIAPDLKLSSLNEPIPSGRPIRAFVYLKAGLAAIDDIQLGDRIENADFKTHPKVIE